MEKMTDWLEMLNSHNLNLYRKVCLLKKQFDYIQMKIVSYIQGSKWGGGTYHASRWF